MASKNKKIFLEDKYCSLVTDRIIKLSENKVEYLLRNNYSLPVFKTHVDGGMYSDETGKDVIMHYLLKNTERSSSLN